MPKAFVDNDVVLKLCRIGHLDDLSGCLGHTEADLAVLGSLRFVVGPRIGADDPGRATFDTFLERVEEAEPTDAEIRLAARMEEAAQHAGHAVDGGESLLFAMAAGRTARVATSDKRAVEGLAAILAEVPDCGSLRGAVVTLEWLASALVLRHGVGSIRAAVCAAPGIDRTLCACFQCQRASCTADDVRAALGSYQRDLARRADGLVGTDLAAAP